VVAVDMPLVWQGAAHMADGYSRVSGRHGVRSATAAARHATATISTRLHCIATWSVRRARRSACSASVYQVRSLSERVGRPLTRVRSAGRQRATVACASRTTAREYPMSTH
jgi:hypothetical protein